MEAVAGCDKVMDKKHQSFTFRWTVLDFSELKSCNESQVHYYKNLPWSIRCMPRKNHKLSEDRTAIKTLGVFLSCNGHNNANDWSIEATAELKLICHKEGSPDFIRSIRHRFCHLEYDWGFAGFMPWSNIIDLENGYLVKDTIVLEVTITADDPIFSNPKNTVKSLCTKISDAKSESERMTNHKLKQEVVPKQENSSNSSVKMEKESMVNLETSKIVTEPQTFAKGSAKDNGQVKELIGHLNQALASFSVKDEYDALCSSFIAKLRQMDSTQRILAENLMQKIITKGLLHKLTENTDISEDTDQILESWEIVNE